MNGSATATALRVDWSEVERELDAWEAEGLRLPVWWRDDDAVVPTEPLEQLLGRAARAGAPIAIASIPLHATEALAERLRREPDVAVLIHGFAHVNHAPETEKQAEFGAHRPLEERVREAREARERIERLFGEQTVRCFTPPWNRVAEDLVAELPRLGYDRLSTFTARAKRDAAPGLLQVNTHVDPIDFHGGARLKDPSLLSRRIAEALRRRRMDASRRGLIGRLAQAASGGGPKAMLRRAKAALAGQDRADNGEPFGLLTHHLVHDAAIWRFVDDWLALLGRRPRVVRWVDIRAVV